MRTARTLLWLLSWLGVFGVSTRGNWFEETPARETHCYSCSSANFEHRWPKDRNNTMLYLTQLAITSNESCDSVRSALPVVRCPNSVCVKFVVAESIANRAVCSSMQTPVIVRDCWSRVLTSDIPKLKLKPATSNPVQLGLQSGAQHAHNKPVGQLYTCSGFLCNKTASTCISPLLIGLLLSVVELFSIDLS